MFNSIAVTREQKVNALKLLAHNDLAESVIAPRPAIDLNQYSIRGKPDFRVLRS